MKILVTGNMGYIGPVLVKTIRDNLENVILYGYDSGFFAHCLTDTGYLPEVLINRQYFGDTRDMPDYLFRDIDSVVHLAAISNDPMGRSFEKATEEINFQASKSIINKAIKNDVKNIVFASSCSMYGTDTGEAKKECDSLNPLTAYARSKVATEKFIEELQPCDTIITSLRFSTACGMSSRLRLDLVLNDFVASALINKRIDVLSNGKPWRPIIDVNDMSSAIIWALNRGKINNQTYIAVNVGSEESNYQVYQIAQAVAQLINGTEININTEAPADKRSYKVDFSYFNEIAPNHQPKVLLEQSIVNLINGLKNIEFNDVEFRKSSLMRLKVLESLISNGTLTTDLCWAK